MNLKKIHNRQSLCALLDDARRALNEASEGNADRFAWNDYHEAEVLYTQALQKFINNEMTKARIIAQQSMGRALEVRRLLERQMDHSKQSISLTLERTSKRLRELRTLFQIEQQKLPRFRIFRCNYYFYQAQETLNRSLGKFFSNNFTKAHEHIDVTKTHLDSVERLLHKDNGQLLKNNHQ